MLRLQLNRHNGIVFIKRTIEITDEKEDNLYLVYESLSKKEEYRLMVAAIRLTVLKQKLSKFFS